MKVPLFGLASTPAVAGNRVEKFAVAIAYVPGSTRFFTGIAGACAHPVISRPASAPTYDLVVALSRLRTREPAAYALAQHIAPGLGATALLGVDVGYRPSTDTALFRLCLDARMITGPLIASAERGARRVGAAVLTLAALAAAERRRLSRLMERQMVRAFGLPDLFSAATYLCDQLGIATDAGTAPPPSLEVRYRKGDAWFLGRLWRLGLDGAFIATGAPPRPGDALEIELCRPGQTPLRIPAVAIHAVSAAAATAAGAAGFLARFAFSTTAEHRALASALAAAPQPPTLAAPPRRRDLRYPVRWPGRLTASGRKQAIRVLDVSRRGAFIASAGCRVGDVATLALPGDDSPPLSLAMRVARVISPEIARERGIEPGVGLELCAENDLAERGYAAFVDRIARRSARRVVICARPPRLSSLIAEFSAAGYSTEAKTHTDDVRLRALTGRGTPDLVVLDDSVLCVASQGNIDALLRVLDVRQIATIRVGHEPPRAARRLADAALAC